MIFGIGLRTVIRLSATLVCCLTILVASPAGAAQSGWGLGALLEELKSETESTVAFTEARHLIHLTEPLILEGTLSFKPPRTLAREVLRPKRESMIIEGNLLSVQTNWKDPPVRVMLSDYPPLEALITALRALLTGDRDLLERDYTTELHGDESAWTLRLVPKAPALSVAVREVLVSGRGDAMEGLEVAETSGDRVVLTFSPPS